MKFTYNPRIIRHLGTELITSDEIAITELIKNSYDAKANEVRIQLIDDWSQLAEHKLKRPVPPEIKDVISNSDINGMIVLEDDGCGMNSKTLERGFFEIGSVEKYSHKQQLKRKKGDEKIILGDKGIGRLSAQRLSPILFVETSTKDENIIHFVRIDWSKFIEDKDADTPDLKVTKNSSFSYTRLWFVGTKDHPVELSKYVEERVHSQEDIFGKPQAVDHGLFVVNALQSALSFLYSPFENRNSVVDLKILFNGKRVQVDFSYDTLKIAETIHSFKADVIKDENNDPVDLEFSLSMKVRPWFLERVHHKELGKSLFNEYGQNHGSYKMLLHKYRDNYEKSLSDKFLLSDLIKKKKWDARTLERLLAIAPINGEIYSFKRDNFLMRLAIDSALENGFLKEDAKIRTDIRPFLEEHNGIKLYRNNFRIATIGNKDNDWLELQQKRTSGQQFYRFELGNVIGFIKINDKYQEYIYETSSREFLTDTEHATSLHSVLNHVLEIFSPIFTRRAVEITKSILDEEGWIVRTDSQEIQKKADYSQDVLLQATTNIKAIQDAFTVLDKNLELDTELKRERVRNVLTGLKSITEGFSQNIEDTQKSFENATKALEIIRSQQERIETDTYNNYKIMANGLITEVITHELHSMLGRQVVEEEYQDHFEAIKSYLFEVKQFDLNKTHLQPVKKRFEFLHGKMQDLNQFYSFIEKTFVYRGTIDELENVDIKSFLEELEGRFSTRLRRSKIELDYSEVTSVWSVPKGSLMHLFYNLIDNSIYWIKERQKRGIHDLSLRRSDDRIVIRSIGKKTIQVYDTGIGILEKMRKTLFLPLQSGKENGRGMGLYIVKNFLKSFGSNIELLSTENDYGNPYIFEIRIASADITEDE